MKPFELRALATLTYVLLCIKPFSHTSWEAFHHAGMTQTVPDAWYLMAKAMLPALDDIEACVLLNKMWTDYFDDEETMDSGTICNAK